MTRQQAKALRFIADFSRAEGCSPSFEEIKEHFGLASKTGASRMVKELVERGFLRKLSGRARSLEITPGGWEELKVTGWVLASQREAMADDIVARVAAVRKALGRSLTASDLKPIILQVLG